MHVLFVNARYHPEGVAGPAFSTQVLAEQLVCEGDRATVVCRSKQPGLHDHHVAGVRVFRLGLEMSSGQVVEQICRLIDADRPDILHTLFPREFPLDRLADAARRRSIPIVHTLLAFFLLCSRGTLMRAGQACTSQCADCREATAPQRYFAARVDAVVGISRFMLDLHTGWGLFLDTTVKAVIHDAYVAPTPPRAPQATRAPLRLGFLGRIDPLKGIGLLLQTLTTELAEGDWTLAIGGQGAAYEEQLKTRHADPRISFLGFVAPTNFLSRIDALVVPSLWAEPFGRVVIEAFAHGVPVVGSDRGGIPEIIEAERTGLIFEPTERGSLARALGDLLGDPRRLDAMKACALEKAAADFAPAQIAAQYRAVYESAVRGAGGS